MRPFKMFFGLAVGTILFLFVARIVFFAFIVAAVMSVVYAMFRRFKDFITYDRFGNQYMPQYSNHGDVGSRRTARIEPLFYDEAFHSGQLKRHEHNIHVS